MRCLVNRRNVASAILLVAASMAADGEAPRSLPRWPRTRWRWPGKPPAQPVAPAAALETFIAGRDALEDTTRSVPPAEPMLMAICPVSRSSALLYLDRPAEAADDGRPLSLAREPGSPGAAGAGLDKLSPRERELVTLVAQGRTDAQIAAQLVISVRTVISHLDRIRARPDTGAAPTSPVSPSAPAWSNAA